MTRTCKTNRQTRRRSGYLYVAVLFTSLIVAASVAASLSLSTGSLRSEIDRINRHSALRLAETEIHRIAARLNSTDSWRSDRISGLFSEWKVLSDDGVHNSDISKVRFKLTDEDGDLSDDSGDSVELTTHAVVGKSQAAVTVVLEPRSAAQSILEYGITAYDDIQIESAGTLSSELPIQVGDDCKTKTSGVLTMPMLECSGRVEMVARGDIQPASVTMPSHDVVDKYVQVGTQIYAASLPIVSGKLSIEDVVLTAGTSPYGSPDAAGIYWIDAGGSPLRISNCRIAATLAIKNASSIEISGGIIWTYAAQPEAILVTDTDITFNNMDAVLDEVARTVNFNPPIAPYRGTNSDSDILDVFPADLQGVIFTTGNILFAPAFGGETLPITGAVICRDLDVDGGYIAVRQLAEVLDSPPLGLVNDIPMQFVRGTFRRIPTP